MHLWPPLAHCGKSTKVTHRGEPCDVWVGRSEVGLHNLHRDCGGRAACSTRHTTRHTQRATPRLTCHPGRGQGRRPPCSLLPPAAQTRCALALARLPPPWRPPCRRTCPHQSQGGRGWACASPGRRRSCCPPLTHRLPPWLGWGRRARAPPGPHSHPWTAAGGPGAPQTPDAPVRGRCAGAAGKAGGVWAPCQQPCTRGRGSGPGCWPSCLRPWWWEGARVHRVRRGHPHPPGHGGSLGRWSAQGTQQRPPGPRSWWTAR